MFPLCINDKNYLLGIVGDVFFKRAHLAVGPLARNIERQAFVEFFPSLGAEINAAYIPILDSSQNIYWDTFLLPFHFELWCMVIAFSFVIAAIKLLVLNCTENSIMLLDGFCFLWTSFIANFGGKPTATKIDKKRSYKVVVFTSLLSGVLIWIIYRSMLTAAFSVAYKKYPFNDMESFSRTNWR